MEKAGEAGPASARSERAQVALEEARSGLRGAAGEVELANGWIESEWEAWRSGRVASLAGLLKANAVANAEAHRAAAAAWEEAVNAIDAAAPQGHA